jgi:hypothetical protein
MVVCIGFTLVLAAAAMWLVAHDGIIQAGSAAKVDSNPVVRSFIGNDGMIQGMTFGH